MRPYGSRLTPSGGCAQATSTRRQPLTCHPSRRSGPPSRGKQLSSWDVWPRCGNPLQRATAAARCPWAGRRGCRRAGGAGFGSALRTLPARLHSCLSRGSDSTRARARWDGRGRAGAAAQAHLRAARRPVRGLGGCGLHLPGLGCKRCAWGVRCTCIVRGTRATVSSRGATSQRARHAPPAGPCAPLGYFGAVSGEGRAEIETRQGRPVCFAWAGCLPLLLQMFGMLAVPRLAVTARAPAGRAHGGRSVLHEATAGPWLRDLGPSGVRDSCSQNRASPLEGRVWRSGRELGGAPRSVPCECAAGRRC